MITKERIVFLKYIDFAIEYYKRPTYNGNYILADVVILSIIEVKTGKIISDFRYDETDGSMVMGIVANSKHESMLYLFHYMEKHLKDFVGRGNSSNGFIINDFIKYIVMQDGRTEKIKSIL